MNKLLFRSVLLSSLASCALAAAHGNSSPRVEVAPNEAGRRVDITIDGKPFTSYIWPVTLKKPTLYPLIAANGMVVTRGFPLDPHPGERVDHPHHAGLWFNYGNANGFDFWNNSDAIKPADRQKMGVVEQRKIVSAKSGDKGKLTVESAWVNGLGQEILKQTTTYDFFQKDQVRIIDQTVTLQALQTVMFHDDKEGMLGMRVASWLESPDEKSGVFNDASGRPTPVNGPSPDASGVYRNSNGVTGDAVWSTRGKWCSLTGHKGDQTVTIAMFDNPRNPGYPTYWHARGYGLFAANPLGRSIFDPKQPAFNYTIAQGSSATFRYRIAFYSQAMPSQVLDQEASDFAGQSE